MAAGRSLWSVELTNETGFGFNNAQNLCINSGGFLSNYEPTVVTNSPYNRNYHHYDYDEPTFLNLPRGTSAWVGVKRSLVTDEFYSMINGKKITIDFNENSHDRNCAYANYDSIHSHQIYHSSCDNDRIHYAICEKPGYI